MAEQSAVAFAVSPEKTRRASYEAALLAFFFLGLIWSAWHAFDTFTWFLEVVPGLIGATILALTWKRFRFTRLVYTLVLIHCLILMVGGHYTYARVPLGEWAKSAFHLTRNHYDRLGHFAQGFVPALIAREVFIRRRIVKPGLWCAGLAFCVCMCITANYELFEYAVAVATGSKSDAFLGSQGDPWDTQNDMLTCLVGSVTALLVFSRWQDRQIREIEHP